MRQLVTTVLEVAGLGSVTTGAAMVEPAAGWIVGGVSAVLVGYLAGRPAPLPVVVDGELG